MHFKAVCQPSKISEEEQEAGSVDVGQPVTVGVFLSWNHDSQLTRYYER